MESLQKIFDTIVVGAGFAGLTAARELSNAGQEVLILEARDRIGGRTWLDERMGLELELGGTWVHWTQPHVWAELCRYGIGLAPSPEPLQAFWWNGSTVTKSAPETLLELLDRPNRLLTARSREAFPQPFAASTAPLAEDLDEISLQEAIDALDLTNEERAVLESFWTLNFNGRIDDAALTQALRWVALTNGDWKVCFEACASYKIAGGTKTLANALRQDTRADVLYGADVRAITSSADTTTVTTAAGQSYHARNVVLTVPLQTLPRIAFEPSLPPQVRDAAEHGQLGLGTKTWFTIEGEHPAFVAFGAAEWPLNFFQSEYVNGGKTYVIGFGSDAEAIDPSDSSAVQEALDRVVPGMQVLESSGHNWVADDLSQETWPMHRTGYLTHSLPALQRPWGAVHFASSDIADGWGGFIDGAIESALTVSRRLLATTLTPQPHVAELSASAL